MQKGTHRRGGLLSSKQHPLLARLRSALPLWECPGSIVDLGDGVAVRTGKGLHLGHRSVPGCLSDGQLAETSSSNVRAVKEVVVEEGTLLGRILGNHSSQTHAESARLSGELCIVLADVLAMLRKPGQSPRCLLWCCRRSKGSGS